MTMTTESLAEAKAHLSELIGRVQAHHERITVTVHGKPSAVIIAPDDLERLEETIAVLSDADSIEQLLASQADIAAQRVEGMAELRQAMRDRGWSG